jgi:hypothetical protein
MSDWGFKDGRRGVGGGAGNTFHPISSRCRRVRCWRLLIQPPRIAVFLQLRHGVIRYRISLLSQTFFHASFGRWHADRSLGLDEERQTQGQLGRTASARRRAQCRSGLPWPETLERYPCFDHRSGCQGSTARVKARRRSCASSGMG